MSDDTPADPKPANNPVEIELRRYEARLGLWKVVLGTMIVGLAGVMIPGIVDFYTRHFEAQRKSIELNQAREAAHEQYIKDFFDTAVNQDIELRIRFANYFANLAGEDQQGQWKAYRDSQIEMRDKLRAYINDHEDAMLALNPNRQPPPTDADLARYNRLKRERDWAYREIGYVPIENVVVSTRGNPKRTLYDETIELVARLSKRNTPFDPSAKDWARFWTLYNVELIGVESPDFARGMIAIGKKLNQLVTDHSLPDAELQKLAEDLTALAHKEMEGNAAAAAMAQ
jgi:hypothetical protein